MSKNKLIPLKHKEIERKLKVLWCKKIRNVKSSHRIRENAVWEEFSVVDHQGKEIKKWTIMWMIKAAGISKQDFLNA